MLAYCLVIGLAFDGLQAVWLRLIAIGLMVVCSTAVTAAAFANFAGDWQAAGYILSLQVVAVIAWSIFRWPLLARTPLLLTPLLILALVSDYSMGLGQFLRQQSNLLITAAGVCFLLGFMISSYKAGWLNSLTRDFSKLVESIQLELKT